MGWGGKRTGAGAKPKPKLPSDTARVLSHPSSVPTTNEPPAPIEEFDAPNDLLSAEERVIWMKQAPHAFANRTLTRASAMSFERYCKVVVLERKESESSARGGANHRGLLRQIQSFEHDFMLTPSGRAMPDAQQARPDAPESKLARFRNG